MVQVQQHVFFKKITAVVLVYKWYNTLEKTEELAQLGRWNWGLETKSIFFWAYLGVI